MQEEATLAEKRQELFTLFRNTAKVAPNEAAAFVGERLGRVLGDASSSVQDVEVTAPTLVAAATCVGVCRARSHLNGVSTTETLNPQPCKFRSNQL